MVKNDPFIPIRFQKDHKGMQGTEYFEGEEYDQCVKDWLKARDAAVEAATSFKHSVTKQLRNRLLEPFMWHLAIVSATEFENFFALRDHKDAEIHIWDLAHKMLIEYNQSNPQKLEAGDWHAPFSDKIDDNRVTQLIEKKYPILDKGPTCLQETINIVKRQICVARAARVSYNNFEGKDDYEKDVEICNKLFGGVPKHLSPCEHVAQALDSPERVGNFTGWKQYRYLFADQSLSDSRVKKQ